MNTVQEKILSFPGLADFPSATLKTILEGRSIDWAADSGTVSSKLINLAIADALVLAVNLPNFKENKLSVDYPRDYWEKTARILYVQNGEPLSAKALVKQIIVPRGTAGNLW